MQSKTTFVIYGAGPATGLPSENLSYLCQIGVFAAAKQHAKNHRPTGLFTSRFHRKPNRNSFFSFIICFFSFINRFFLFIIGFKPAATAPQPNETAKNKHTYYPNSRPLEQEQDRDTKRRFQYLSKTSYAEFYRAKRWFPRLFFFPLHCD